MCVCGCVCAYYDFVKIFRCTELRVGNVNTVKQTRVSYFTIARSGKGFVQQEGFYVFSTKYSFPLVKPIITRKRLIVHSVGRHDWGKTGSFWRSIDHECAL